MVTRARISFTTSLLAFLLLAVWSCMPRQSQQPGPESAPPSGDLQGYLEHHVQYSGETLAIISAWYTGKATNWNTILAANPGLRPDRIRIGQVINVPKDLVVKSEPMPKSFMKSVPVTVPEKPKGDAQGMSSSSQAQASSASSSEMIASPTGSVEASSSSAAVMKETVTVSSKEQASPVAVSSSSAISSVTGQGSSVSPEDQEREKLLDELLK